MDPNAFHRGPPRGGFGGPRGGFGPPRGGFGGHNQQLYQPAAPRPNPNAANGPCFDGQWRYLEQVASEEIPRVQIEQAELDEKDAFRATLEELCRSISSDDPGQLPLTLKSFGSLMSGFATRGSDMDLVIVSSTQGPQDHHLSLDADSLPRMLEKRLLERGYGARLLTRARVPIIKICEKPPPELLDALRKERQRWDALPEEEKYADKGPKQKEDKKSGGDGVTESAPTADTSGSAAIAATEKAPAAGNEPNATTLRSEVQHTDLPVSGDAVQDKKESSQAAQNDNNRNNRKAWTREKVAGPLDFPKGGIGIQCDINFFNPLGLHNTQLLRCYSLCDSRVRPMILFVKAWAKKRKINSSYSGTLSSYGYVLMVLNYLVNIARPPVLPNLQRRAAEAGLPAVTVDDWTVQFWRDEEEIQRMAERNILTQNREPLGVLLRGFFQYFASTQGGYGFHWMQDVLSLSTPGGLLSKEDKGWTAAKTEVSDNVSTLENRPAACDHADTTQKEVRQRYLFAIEDPFELSHNVARTVTHPGIVAIRDEFRRAWRILIAAGYGQTPRDGPLFADPTDDDLVYNEPRPKPNAQNQQHQHQQRAQAAKQIEDQQAAVLAVSQTPPQAAGQTARPEVYAEISGERAQAYLEDVKKNRGPAVAAKSPAANGA